jgi:hypothetical protein
MIARCNPKTNFRLICLGESVEIGYVSVNVDIRRSQGSRYYF